MQKTHYQTKKQKKTIKFQFNDPEEGPAYPWILYKNQSEEYFWIRRDNYGLLSYKIMPFISQLEQDNGKYLSVKNFDQYSLVEKTKKDESWTVTNYVIEKLHPYINNRRHRNYKLNDVDPHEDQDIDTCYDPYEFEDYED